MNKFTLLLLFIVLMFVGTDIASAARFYRTGGVYIATPGVGVGVVPGVGVGVYPSYGYSPYYGPYYNPAIPYNNFYYNNLPAPLVAPGYYGPHFQYYGHGGYYYHHR